MELNITENEIVVICDKLLQIKDRNGVTNARLALFNQCNGDAFYKQTLWPKSFRVLFFKKPPTDVGTFKLLLFLLGNGAPPHLAIEWILTSQFWSKDSSAFIKRTEQIRNVVRNIDKRMDQWFYLDIHWGKVMYLNGTTK